MYTEFVWSDITVANVEAAFEFAHQYNDAQLKVYINFVTVGETPM